MSTEIISEDRQKYMVIGAALVVQLCLGSIYAWSIFKKALLAVPYSASDVNASLPFSIGLLSFALVMIVAGRLQDQMGPKKIATIGGILLGTGYLLAGLPEFLNIFAADDPLLTIWLVLTYGVIGGAGIGFAYVCPIAALVKWFPDIKGLITGIAVAGFGAGALIFAQVERILINFGTEPNIGFAFIILGIVYLIAVTGSAQFLKNPPEGYSRKAAVAKTSGDVTPSVEYEWREMIYTPQFWLLWFMFVLAASAGLMTIGNVSPFVQAQNTAIDGIMAANIVGVLSIFNALGRIVWGATSDRLGRTITMATMFAILGITMILFGSQTDVLLLTIGAAIIGFCFGGNFALFPSSTADFFGTKNVGSNYGFVFTAYGIAGVFGPILAGTIVEQTGGYGSAFFILGVLAFVAVILALVSEYLQRAKK
ncbi:MAG: MFS transporter [Candidatus Heimdallarchaeota archaeon]|nr:MFS transporter [Candidatus Heimdallarchaeota archaeon]